jgi:hypothetical protein
VHVHAAYAKMTSYSSPRGEILTSKISAKGRQQGDRIATGCSGPELYQQAVTESPAMKDFFVTYDLHSNMWVVCCLDIARDRSCLELHRACIHSHHGHGSRRPLSAWQSPKSRLALASIPRIYKPAVPRPPLFFLSSLCLLA